MKRTCQKLDSEVGKNRHTGQEGALGRHNAEDPGIASHRTSPERHDTWKVLRRRIIGKVQMSAIGARKVLRKRIIGQVQMSAIGARKVLTKRIIGQVQMSAVRGPKKFLE